MKLLATIDNPNKSIYDQIHLKVFPKLHFASLSSSNFDRSFARLEWEKIESLLSGWLEAAEDGPDIWRCKPPDLEASLSCRSLSRSILISLEVLLNVLMIKHGHIWYKQ